MRLLVVSYQLKWPGGSKIADDEHDEDKHILITWCNSSDYDI